MIKCTTNNSNWFKQILKGHFKLNKGFCEDTLKIYYVISQQSTQYIESIPIRNGAVNSPKGRKLIIHAFKPHSNRVPCDKLNRVCCWPSSSRTKLRRCRRPVNQFGTEIMHKSRDPLNRLSLCSFTGSVHNWTQSITYFERWPFKWSHRRDGIVWWNLTNLTPFFSNDSLKSHHQRPQPGWPRCWSGRIGQGHLQIIRHQAVSRRGLRPW